MSTDCLALVGAPCACGTTEVCRLRTENNVLRARIEELRWFLIGRENEAGLTK
jgi:hypothetical protein